jgi:L-aminopeptidase/D-esterase-like protein
MTTLNNSITDIQGIKVGHAHDPEALTGCTVILCPKGTTGGVDSAAERRALEKPMSYALCI